MYCYSIIYTYSRNDAVCTSSASARDGSLRAKTTAKARGAPRRPSSSTTQDNLRVLSHLCLPHSARLPHSPRPPPATHSGCHCHLPSRMLPASHDTPNTSGASSARSEHSDRSPVATAQHSSWGGHTLHSASGTSWRTNRIQVRVVVRPRRASMRGRHRHTSISRALRRDGCTPSIPCYVLSYCLL
jgi:hypothetical protein